MLHGAPTFTDLLTQEYAADTYTLYPQGNLDERCTDALIWELMLQAGPVGECRAS